MGTEREPRARGNCTWRLIAEVHDHAGGYYDKVYTYDPPAGSQVLQGKHHHPPLRNRTGLSDQTALVIRPSVASQPPSYRVWFSTPPA